MGNVVTPKTPSSRDVFKGASKGVVSQVSQQIWQFWKHFLSQRTVVEVSAVERWATTAVRRVRLEVLARFKQRHNYREKRRVYRFSLHLSQAVPPNAHWLARFHLCPVVSPRQIELKPWLWQCVPHDRCTRSCFRIFVPSPKGEYINQQNESSQPKNRDIWQSYIRCSIRIKHLITVFFRTLLA